MVLRSNMERKIRMNGFLLLIPFLMIRFGFLYVLNKAAVRRAAHFPPMIGNEKIAYWLYQISNIALFMLLFILTVAIEFSLRFYIGIIIYLAGLVLCTISVMNFAVLSEHGFSENGLYRYSRNPMYVSYFIYFMGCALLTQSVILVLIILIFQISAHWIILSEERWCAEKFGQRYMHYQNKVRRYI